MSINPSNLHTEYIIQIALKLPRTQGRTRLALKKTCFSILVKVQTSTRSLNDHLKNLYAEKTEAWYTTTVFTLVFVTTIMALIIRTCTLKICLETPLKKTEGSLELKDKYPNGIS